MFESSLILAAVLAIDGGTPVSTVFVQEETAAGDALRRCNERLADASKVEHADGDAAEKLAAEAINWGAPARDELEAMVMVYPDLTKVVGATGSAHLTSLVSQLTECVRSADFVVARVAHTLQQKSPGSDSAREAAAAEFNEYLLRYPKHSTAATVRGWLQHLDTGKKELRP